MHKKASSTVDLLHNREVSALLVYMSLSITGWFSFVAHCNVLTKIKITQNALYIIPLADTPSQSNWFTSRPMDF